MHITKKCSNCNIDKSLEEFHKDHKGKHGRRSDCKQCFKIKKYSYIQTNQEKIKQTKKNHYQKNYHELKNDLNNKNRIKYAQAKEMSNLEQEIICSFCLIPKQVTEFEPLRKECKLCRNIKKKHWEKDNKHNNIQRKISTNLRSRIWFLLKEKNKSEKFINFLGCTTQELISHLEKQFTPEMNWNNYGKFGWHIDHIKPCAAFDLSKPEEQQKCFHYTNLQPLWWSENLSKGFKF